MSCSHCQAETARDSKKRVDLGFCYKINSTEWEIQYASKEIGSVKTYAQNKKKIYTEVRTL